MNSLYTVLISIIQAYKYLILARVILSWLPSIRDNFLVRFIYEMTEPFLRIFRRILPPSPNMPIDLSPILGFLALSLITNGLTRLFY
jgi:uncharacterized protein YggT (Ycf19 family)